MSPDFRILADGEDVTSSFQDRLVDITVRDNAGVKTDEVSIVIDDTPDDLGQLIILPTKGIKLTVFLGYLDLPNQEFICPLTLVGVFTIDERGCAKSERGRFIEIRGHSVDTGGTLKQPRTRSYHRTTLGEVVTQCCTRNGLEPVIEKAYGDIKIVHLDQVNESDGSFLDRLYNLYGAITKPMNGRILFGSPENVRTLIGEKSDVIPVDEQSTLEWKWLDQSKGRYSAVRSKFHDKDAGRMFTSTSDATDNNHQVYHVLPRTYASKDDADASCGTKKKGFDRQHNSMSFTCLGNPQFKAGSKVSLKNFRQEVPTEWVLTSVTHRFSDSGFTTTCEVSAKDKKGDGDEGSNKPLSLFSPDADKEPEDPTSPAPSDTPLSDAFSTSETPTTAQSVSEIGDPNTVLPGAQTAGTGVEPPPLTPP